MEEWLIYLVGTLIVVDMIIFVAWAVPHFAGARLGYRWRKLLWLVLSVRLLIPVRMILNGVYEDRSSYFVQFDVPLMYGTGGNHGTADINNVQGTQVLEAHEDTEKAAAYEMDHEETASMPESISDVVSAGSMHLSERQNHFGKWALLIVWIFGAFALIVSHSIHFMKVKEWISKESRRCTDPWLRDQEKGICEEYHIRSVPQIFLCGHIRSPMLFGYGHTRLLMPDRPYTEMESGMIFRHELQHKKSWDLWYKLLLMIVCDLYWFNPVLRLMEWLAYQDVECVCDSQVLRRLSAEEKKIYGNIVLNHMAKIDVRTVGYGTSIFTGKKAAKMRIRNMFVKKNKWGYIVLGVLTLCAAAGSSMWVLSGQSMENVSILDSPRSDVEGEQSEVLSRTSSAVYEPPSDVEGEPDQDVVRASNIVIVEDMQDISRAKDLNDLNYYTTDIIRAGNHYWIDEQNTLWGTGYSEYGQLGELREDLSQIREPVKIAENVKHVDFSGEYFAAFCILKGCGIIMAGGGIKAVSG